MTYNCTIQSYDPIGPFSIFSFSKVPTDENGLIVEELDKLLKAHSYRKRSATEKKPFWGFVYLMTIFKNPTGQSLPEGTVIMKCCGYSVFKFFFWLVGEVQFLFF